MARKGQKFRKWTFEEKLQIVKQHTEEHVSVQQLSKAVGARHTLICEWVRRYQEYGEEGLQPRKRTGNPYAALSTSKSLTEVERLRLLVIKQEIEIERLKKGYRVEGAGADKKYVTDCDKSTKSSKPLE